MYQTCNMREDDQKETDLHSITMQVTAMGKLALRRDMTGIKVVLNPYCDDYEVIMMVGKKYFDELQSLGKSEQEPRK